MIENEECMFNGNERLRKKLVKEGTKCSVLKKFGKE